MTGDRVRTAILISGRGSNMAALIRAAEADDYPADIRLVLSDSANAGGLALAKQAGISTAVVERQGFATKEAHEEAIDRTLAGAGIELVCLAGFMRVLSPGFVTRWRGRMLNIHPSLLPAFRGLDTHARALAAGATAHGCTVHFVSEALDAGGIVAQARVPVLADDTPDTLTARVLEAEHKLYPEAVRRVAEELRRAPQAGFQLSPVPNGAGNLKLLVLTRHVEIRMRERDLQFSWIEQAARQPLWTEAEPNDPTAERRFAAIDEFGGRILRVVCVETDTAIRVITATFDGNARRKP